MRRGAYRNALSGGHSRGDGDRLLAEGRLVRVDALDAPAALLAPLSRPGAVPFTLAFAVFFGLLLWAFREASATNVSTGDS